VLVTAMRQVPATLIGGLAKSGESSSIFFVALHLCGRSQFFTRKGFERRLRASFADSTSKPAILPPLVSASA